MLVTLPCLCLLLDFWPLNRFAVAPAAGRRNVPRSSGRPGRGEGPSETSACRPGERRPRVETAARRAGCAASRSRLLLLEKVPLLALSLASAVITPYAQGHGGSMASESELSFAFRIENSLAVVLDVHHPHVLAGQDVGALPPGRGTRQPLRIRRWRS